MADSRTATFVSFDGNRAVVRLDDGSEVALRMIGSYLPQPGDIVRVTRDEGGVVVDGLAVPRQPTATILRSRLEGASSRLVYEVRTTDDRTQVVEALDHIPNPAPGDVVVLFANYIIGRLSAAPIEGDTP